jgi:phospholipase C
MSTRREFLQQAAVLSGIATWSGAFPDAIAKALAIDPEPNSTFLDAEHVVILMQENRSFDHAFGSLQGVRGFNDPRAITLPDGNPVWVQTNERGESYAPFRLNINDTNITWAGCLPHGRPDQVDARNGGRHDRWLTAKRSGERAYADMPLTLGYYTRDDIPFYYALADAFTICDQYFCSAITSTTPNRLYLWTGTIREKPTADSLAHLWNDDTVYESEASWKTFPERLEDHGVSWKVYQNELALKSGLNADENAWLANYGDNPLEYFTQYRVRFAKSHRDYLEKESKKLLAEIKRLESQLGANSAGSEQSGSIKQQLEKKSAALHDVDQQRSRWSGENFEKLSSREKSLHSRAFDTNNADPNYRELATHKYRDGTHERSVRVPKGDILRSFRDDVRNGKLPTVSWLVAPERFSDHPSSAWYGAWYIAEALDILTSNPAVWKKTIFILTYDENDGYFDHVPPFVAPNPEQPNTGRTSPGIDASVEYVTREQELKHRAPRHVRESPIGLGYRVPMIIASPWSRGGCVCSQVFDHTSVLQFLEKLLTHKTGRKVEESNISQWRRTVCGDLTSIFRAYEGPNSGLPAVPDRDDFVEKIHRAQFKEKPSGFRRLSQLEIGQIRNAPRSAPHLARQEPGVRRSSPLPYELAVNGELDSSRTRFTIRFEVKNKLFGARSAGSPFTVYARTGDRHVEIRNYAVAAGTTVDDSWPIADFASRKYDLRVYGPNGFYREFAGSVGDPSVRIDVDYLLPAAPDVRRKPKIVARIRNNDAGRPRLIVVRDHAYGRSDIQRLVAPNTDAELQIDTVSGWYDLAIQVDNDRQFLRRYAGRVESGSWSISDPGMAGLRS